jgi:hypothetical protein
MEQPLSQSQNDSGLYDPSVISREFIIATFKELYI